ncbi:hypothetical protein [Ferrovibrio sp.]|uniref:hypothetical protein n=1 Tax=Ferrovibrio sp. TaxID=1917215 RepID=UPI0035B240D0
MAKPKKPAAKADEQTDGDYIVVTPLRLGGDILPPGEEVTLTDSEAKPLLACGAVVVATAKPEVGA